MTSPTATAPNPRARAAAVERRVIRTVFQPPPRMTVDEWADSYRYLSPEASAEPGRYATSRAPYQREPMRALSDPRVRTVVLMWPSQVGKTEVLNNFVGQRIHLNPGPMLILQPTLQMGEAWSKDRLAPMLRDTPVLRGKVKDARSRASDNTLLHKKFPGGHITIAGANSPAGLAARPIRDVLTDEVDRYPVSAGTEGDPIGLADRRSSTFRNGKRLRISSPTVRGRSRIEAEYQESTRERWHVPCPHCHELQILRWGGRETSYGVKWDAGRPTTAHYVCAHCAAVIEDAHKGWMNANGRWIAENPGHPVRGFWTNALISPWVPWSDLVSEYVRVKDDPIRLRQFVNTVLCETWEDEGVSIDAHALFNRLEEYPARVPAGVAVLTRSVDVQGDRLETAVWGYGAREEAWLIDWELIPGDPGTESPWRALEARLAQDYEHELGPRIRPAVTFIDSGGHHAKEVYAFTRRRPSVFAIKGMSTEGAPLLGRANRNNDAKAILYPVGSFTGKESVLARLAIAEAGPGYIHLPLVEWMDGERLSQFTNEKLVTRIVAGRPKRIFIQTGRTEQFHLAVYCLAGLQKLLPTPERLAQWHAQLVEAGEKLRAARDAGEPTAAAAPRRKIRNPFVQRWRH